MAIVSTYKSLESVNYLYFRKDKLPGNGDMDSMVGTIILVSMMAIFFIAKLVERDTTPFLGQYILQEEI